MRSGDPARGLIVGVLLAAGVSVGSAAEAPAPRRPKTALVLSGGGARGVAHIGVLRVLERERIPVDLVVGTSVGSVVGGLYASGHSPETIERWFRDTDWSDLMTDEPPRRDVSFRRKEDDLDPLFGFELGVKRSGITLPGGLIAGQKLGTLLRSLTLGAAGTGHFDGLPIPFRAVATDLDSGEMVVLDSGEIADAIRASMAVPGVFTPVEWNGRTLVDGGLVMNLPIQVALDLGAERVIAVDVSTRLADLDSGKSVFGVAVQTIGLLTDRNIAEQRARIGPRDVLITPELDEIEVADFDAATPAIGAGERAAESHLDALRAMAVGDEAWARWLERQRAAERRDRPEWRIDSIEVRGVKRVSPEIVRRRIKLRPGRPLDLGELREDLSRIYRIGEFQKVDFRLLDEEGTHLLEIDAEEKSWGPRYLRFGMGLEANFEGQGDFTMLANYRQTHLNRLGAEWKSVLRIGDTDGVFTEWYQPLEYSGFWFVAPRVEAVRDQRQFFDDTGTFVDSDYDLLSAGVDLGVQLRNYGELRFGATRGKLDADLGSPAGTQPLSVDLGGWRVRLAYDQLDNANFPRRGTLATAQLFLSRDRLGATDEYDRLDLTVIRAVSVGDHTLVGQVKLGSNLSSQIPFYDEFQLGGFLNLSGLVKGQLQGDVLGYASLIYFNRVGRLPRALGDGVYIGGALEAGNVWADLDQAEVGDLRPAALVFGGADTLMGPVYLGYGRADGGEDSFYLFLGRLF